MKQYIAIFIAWIVSLFTFWKLGENNGKNKEKLSKHSETEKTLAKAVDLRNNVDMDVNSVRKKWKRSKK